MSLTSKINSVINGRFDLDPETISKVWTFNAPIRTFGYTVATLPTGVTGYRAYVTNALTPAFNATVVGGGAVTVPVFYNGANWVVG
jgi:hypothetical protein